FPQAVIKLIGEIAPRRVISEPIHSQAGGDHREHGEPAEGIKRHQTTGLNGRLEARGWRPVVSHRGFPRVGSRIPPPLPLFRGASQGKGAWSRQSDFPMGGETGKFREPCSSKGRFEKESSMSTESEQTNAPSAGWPVLGMVERRLLGVLVEKAKTTPGAYPM